jgi:hypothetical protein
MIASFSPDGGSLTPRKEIEYLVDWLGVAATSALITEIVTDAWVNTDAKLSAAVGLLEVGLVNDVTFSGSRPAGLRHRSSARPPRRDSCRPVSSSFPVAGPSRARAGRAPNR